MSFNLFKKLSSPAKNDASSSKMPAPRKKVKDDNKETTNQQLETSPLNLPDLQTAKQEMAGEEDDLATSDISAIKNALEEIASGSKLNDHRILGELPYFGISENSSKSWIVTDCSDFFRIYN